MFGRRTPGLPVLSALRGRGFFNPVTLFRQVAQPRPDALGVGVFFGSWASLSRGGAAKRAQDFLPALRREAASWYPLITPLPGMRNEQARADWHVRGQAPYCVTCAPTGSPPLGWI